MQEKTAVILGTFISMNVLVSEVILALHVLCNFATAFYLGQDSSVKEIVAVNENSPG